MSTTQNKRMTNTIKLAFFVGILKFVTPLQNGLGLTPPMGWNTWNRYYCDID
jgi:hypothetical protein